MPTDPSWFADSADIPTKTLGNIYSSEIAPAYLDGLAPAEDKRAILIGGQPGAGKSSVQDSLSAEIEDDFVAIDADELRDYVPGYTDRARTVDQAQGAANWSHAATQYLTSRLLEDAILKGVNFVFDATLAKSDKAIDLISRLQANGYEVDVAYVCTHRSISERGVQQRYFYDKRDVGSEMDAGDLIPRYVPSAVQSEAFTGLSAVVKAVDRHSHNTTDVQLSLWERNSELGEPAKQIPFKPGEASQALEQAQQRQLSSFEQLTAHFREWNDLTVMITNPASRATLNELRETSLIYSTQLERHDWEVPNRFQRIVMRLLTSDRALSARGNAYRKGDGEGFMRMAREYTSQRLHEHINEIPGHWHQRTSRPSPSDPNNPSR
ncbi:zeta toxin family protein [Halomonas urumqiensis]|uniref:Zeta toxin domain-containing protein n=1 Tax=Halomonas urumqiensis TaxID=1684789 RepID=A0A2N7UKE9_9GAMM|nr:zeta toxin family protein [Halomonas urumqiensis]PMR80904.1 hypothetical protein C1H70_07570 [Halomonas urumqiensis]PTB02861.1 hypothetical protein C6V82_09570 [Halomonas urumqiensis]GHE21381.1 hypothetical protein GCM10017767_19020 [Halomonas urumqiensis]